MESKDGDTPLLSLRERFLKSWFPPAAVVGGVATLVVAALRVRPAQRTATAAAPPSGAVPAGAETPPPVPAGQSTGSTSLTGDDWQRDVFARRSARVCSISPWGLTTTCTRSATARCASSRPTASLVRRWRVADTAECVGVGPDGRVYVGGAGRIDIYENDGRPAGGFAFGGAGDKPAVSAIRVFKADILVADPSARIIRRFDAAGRQLGVIGDQSKTKAFILPNGRLDIDVDAAGVVRATDTGRHQVTSWAIDGTPVGRFGKFGMSDPADFVGCCNPVNLATGPGGVVVTAEKMVARVKVYAADGRLLAVIGPGPFDPACTQIHLAVDSKGRILAADPVRRLIQVFSPAAPAGTHEVRRMNEHSTRRQFIDRSCRLVGYVTIGGAAGLLAKRAAANSVYQVDPNKCTELRSVPDLVRAESLGGKGGQRLRQVRLLHALPGLHGRDEQARRAGHPDRAGSARRMP